MYEEVLSKEYGPEYSCHKVYPRLMQQTDIMPTLLDYLGIDANTVCFGTSAFRNPDYGWQISYGNSYYQLETPDGIASNSSKPLYSNTTIASSTTKYTNP